MDRSRKLNLQFSLIQFLFWMAECSICGFPVIFYGKLGFTESEIGFLTALSPLCGILIQPVYPQILSRFPEITIYSLLSVLYGTAIAVSGVTFFLPVRLGVFIAMIVLLTVTEFSTTTLVNAAAMDLISQGHALNFGMTRGMGSVAWALTGIFCGRLLDVVDPRSLLIVNAASLTIMLFILTRMKAEFPLSSSQPVSPEKNSAALSKSSMLKMDAAILLLCLGGCVLHMGIPVFESTRISNFLSRFSGTAADAGIGVFLAAASEFPMMILVDILKKKTEFRKIMRFSLFVFMLRPFLIVFAPNKTLLLLTQLLNGSCFGMYLISSVSYIGEISDNSTRVANLAYFSTFQSLGNMVGNLACGMLMDSAGLPGIAFYGTIASIVGGIILLIGLRRDRRGCPGT